MKLDIHSESPETMQTTIHAAGGLTWTIDEPVAMGGNNQGPNPLEAVLGAWAGCLSIVIRMVAKEAGLNLGAIEVHATGEFDPRGFMGVPQVSPYFSLASASIKVARLRSEDVEALTHALESRCPVSAMMRAAGISTHVSLSAL